MARTTSLGAGQGIFLSHAKHYRDVYGWSVIPVRGKKPTGSWKQYQQRHPSDPELQKLFLGKHTGIAVICGSVSNNLICRDYDVRKGYFAWKKAHPDLAETLPTVETARGFHVYCCVSADALRNSRFADGEYRGNGCYVVLPPSKHPETNKPYRWVVAPTDGIPFILDPKEAGLAADLSNEESRSNLSFKVEDPSAPLSYMASSGSFGSSTFLNKEEEIEWKVQEAIERTLPIAPGQRNRSLLDLARMLWAIEGLDTGMANLRGIVKRWHAGCVHTITTKEFDQTWIDFVRAWERKKWPKGQTVLALVEEAKRRPLPKAALFFDSPRRRLLVALCAVLQEKMGDDVFYLSGPDAGKCVGLTPKCAWEALNALCSPMAQVLKLECRGKPGGKRSNRYRFISDITPSDEFFIG